MMGSELDSRRVCSLLAGRLEAEADEGVAGELLPSAVLLPILDRAQVASLLFIRRSRRLPDHAGQVSFPGGVREPGDSDLYATALRESVEEVGVDAQAVQKLGALRPVSTLEKYLIHPYVTHWPDREYGIASPDEVERVFAVPLPWLLAAGKGESVDVTVADRSWRVPAWRYDGEVIWGATRRITQDFLARLRVALAS